MRLPDLPACIGPGDIKVPFAASDGARRATNDESIARAQREGIAIVEGVEIEGLLPLEIPRSIELREIDVVDR